MHSRGRVCSAGARSYRTFVEELPLHDPLPLPLSVSVSVSAVSSPCPRSQARRDATERCFHRRYSLPVGTNSFPSGAPSHYWIPTPCLKGETRRIVSPWCSLAPCTVVVLRLRRLCSLARSQGAQEDQRRRRNVLRVRSNFRRIPHYLSAVLSPHHRVRQLTLDLVGRPHRHFEEKKWVRVCFIACMARDCLPLPSKAPT